MGINQTFLEIADKLTPELHKKVVRPKQLTNVTADPFAFQGWKTEYVGSLEEIQDKPFGNGDSFTLDFGDHQVGYFSLSVKSVGSPQDAPLRLKFIFGEMPCEIGEPFENYQGWLSSSWLQEETITVDVLPIQLTLPRRYSFRYVKVVIVDTSVKYKVVFNDIHCTTVTSGDASQIEPLPEDIPDELQVMDKIAIKTLGDCMQTVFEDGPKRDRRLWIGDLRLQALANYYTFKNYNLARRCLYLFAGYTLENGEVGACIFEKPQPLIDDTLLYDYSLFFVASLYDYYMATEDRKTLDDLWPIAQTQLKIAVRSIDYRGVIKDDPSWWCFVDWHPELNKQASAQAVLLYCLKRGLLLAKELEKKETSAWIENYIDLVSNAALTYLWDEEKGFFTSGENAQISWASQIWMVLAEVLEQKENEYLMERLFEESPSIGISTPYMYHHLIEALILSGKKEKALEQMNMYWGGMIEDGADCFWELYSPTDKALSPYGSNIINSYCHAWSCTPTYFIRKYFID